jgi:hypothetical protein
VGKVSQEGSRESHTTRRKSTPWKKLLDAENKKEKTEESRYRRTPQGAKPLDSSDGKITEDDSNNNESENL